MARESSVIIGSGTIPYTASILSPEQGGITEGARGIRTGTNVVLINPEDLTASTSFLVSGVSIGSTPTKIWGPELNSLSRQREVWLHNDGPGTVFFGQSSTSVIAPSGMSLTTSDPTIKLPLMHNASIWARALGAGGAEIRILAF